jgi:hypothetical protein
MKPASYIWKLVLRLLLPQQSAQFHSGLVQLRLGSPNRAAQHSRYLFVFVSFNIVKGKDRAVAGRQLNNRFIQGYAIHDRHRIGVFRAFDYLYRSFAVVGRLFHLDAAFAEVHQDLVDGQPVQPGGKSGLTSKTSNFSKELDEDLLCKVFRLRDVTGHSQAQRVNPAIMTLVKLLEGSHITLSGFLSQRVICFLLRLGFGCGHVFVMGQATKESASLMLVRRDYHESACFKGAITSASASSKWCLRAVGRPQRGCDAGLRARRCLTRPKRY